MALACKLCEKCHGIRCAAGLGAQCRLYNSERRTVCTCSDVGVSSTSRCGCGGDCKRGDVVYAGRCNHDGPPCDKCRPHRGECQCVTCTHFSTCNCERCVGRTGRCYACGANVPASACVRLSTGEAWVVHTGTGIIGPFYAKEDADAACSGVQEQFPSSNCKVYPLAKGRKVFYSRTPSGQVNGPWDAMGVVSSLRVGCKPVHVMPLADEMK